MNELRGPPKQLRSQWIATRVFSIGCGIVILAGFLILWFGARGFFAVGNFSCAPTGCNFPPSVQILTLPVAVVLGTCAAALGTCGGGASTLPGGDCGRVYLHGHVVVH